MSQKIIYLLQLLICLVGVPTVFTKECYQCNNPANCVSPSVIQCDQSAANRTRDELKLYFLNVPDIVSSNYMCLRTNTTQSNGISTEIRGCIYDETKACNLTLNTAGSYWSRSNCFYCSTNLCNSAPNIAGYRSSVAIIALSVASLLLTNVPGC